MAADEIILRGSRAAVGNVDEISAGLELEQFAREMPGRSGAGGCKRHFCAAAPALEHFGSGRIGRLGRHHKGERHRGGERDRLHVFQWIVGHAF
jgi:hypothetical protein